jgi:non-canonical poly(A) RNA polymerase PAPD5/7
MVRLHREVEAFYDYLSPTDEEHKVREMIICTIERAIVASFPDAKLKPFGSFETRLYLPMGCEIILNS